MRLQGVLGAQAQDYPDFAPYRAGGKDGGRDLSRYRL
jgi:hypothetical protein